VEQDQGSSGSVCDEYYKFQSKRGSLLEKKMNICSHRKAQDENSSHESITAHCRLMRMNQEERSPG